MSILPDFEPQVQCNTNQNSSKLFCGYRQNDDKVYTRSTKPRRDSTLLNEKNTVGGLQLLTSRLTMRPQELTQHGTDKRANRPVGQTENLEIDSLTISKSFTDGSLVAKGLA